MTKLATTILILGLMTCRASAQDKAPAKPAGAPPEVNNLLQYRGVPAGLIPGNYPLYVLMNNPKIVDLLDLSEKQAMKWDEAKKKQAEVRSAYEKVMDPKGSDILVRLKKAFDADDAEAKEKEQEARAEYEAERRRKNLEFADAIDKHLLGVLNPKQEARLREIRLQAEGTEAFKREDVQVALGLVPEQIQEIGKINFEHVRRLRKAATLPPPPPAEKAEPARAKKKSLDPKVVNKTLTSMASVRVESMRSIERLLSSTQRKIYKNMIGEPFDFLGPRDEEKTEIGQAEK